MIPLFSEIDLWEDVQEEEGFLQMAIDEVLLRKIKRPLLRHYRWKGPWVSFGYFQKWQEVHRMFPAHKLVRRWSGGGAVDHTQDWTFSLIVPSTHPLRRISVAASYGEIHLRLKTTLSHFFSNVREVAEEKEALLDPCAVQQCFLSPIRNDLCYKGLKVAGGAQRRSFWGLLHQGSIQRLVLPPSFAHEFAACLASHTHIFFSSKTIRDNAIKLAMERYETRAWLEKI